MDIFTYVFGREKADLGRKLKGFETRPQQMQMVQAVCQALDEERHLIVEAGTGVGKSLAYLLPLIKWTIENKKKAVISTYTKTLQEQLVRKDLPRLQRILGIDFKFVLCQGSQNYLCLRRFHRESQAELSELFEKDRERKQFTQIKQWLPQAKTALHSEFPFKINKEIWERICREGDQCLGKKSPFHKDCFYYKARRQMHKADILVTNHHLFFSHIASGGRFLPSFDAVVFDEAHTLEDVATGYLGMEVSNTQIKYYLDSLFNPRTNKGLLSRVKGVHKHERTTVIKRLAEVRDEAESFFSSVFLQCGEETRTMRISRKQIVENTITHPLRELTASLKKMVGCIESKEDEIELMSFISRGQDFSSTLDVIMNMEQKNHVYWIELAKRANGNRCSFLAAPIDISAEFRDKIFRQKKPVILTSATISSDGNFEFIKKRLGIEEDINEMILSSPFDFEKKAILYLTRSLPDPGRQQELYQQRIIEEIKQILLLMKGRTFILFTSFKMMREVDRNLKEFFENLRILKQGDAPRYQLLEIFRHNHNSVLLGTNTFWQGIDIPGRALECVIISKLPFAVPDEPVVEARMEYLTSQGKNPFEHYQLPRAIIMLKQGFGRLIRTQHDSGMVAILDPRIMTRHYGHKFLNVLPRCRQIYDIDQARQFLKPA